jgi:hypothetical protein
MKGKFYIFAEKSRNMFEYSIRNKTFSAIPKCANMDYPFVLTCQNNELLAIRVGLGQIFVYSVDTKNRSASLKTGNNVDHRCKNVLSRITP